MLRAGAGGYHSRGSADGNEACDRQLPRLTPWPRATTTTSPSLHSAGSAGTSLESLPRWCSKAASRLLELGCGTGEDAIHLALRGHRVVATDASAKMIGIARHKSERAGVADRIRFIHSPMQSLTDQLGDEVFDGVYSNFGAVNCVPDVPALARDLTRRLASGAPLIFVVMGRYSPWEWAWYLARGERAQAFRRLRPGGVEWRGLRIQYPTPAMLERELAPSFRSHAPCRARLRIAAELCGRLARLFAASAGGAERHRSGDLRFTAGLGDHFIFEAARA